MAAGEALHPDGQGSAVKVLPGNGQCAGAGIAAGAADRENALGLGVQVEHLAALQRGHIQHSRTQQADLLVGGEHSLHPGMGQIVRVQHGHGHGHGDAVVAAQGRALGIDVIAVHRQVQSLPVHILFAAGGLLAHHVQVALQDGRLGRLIAGVASLMMITLLASSW